MTDEKHTYDIEGDDEPAAAQVKPAAAVPATAISKSSATGDERSGPGHGHGHGPDHDDESDDDLLPPPISRESNPTTWLVIAGTCLALLAISWLAGARALAPIEATTEGSVIRELGFMDRLIGLARMLVYAPLATLSIVFGLLSLAFLRQRPVGDVAALFARAAAITAIGLLACLVPVEIRFAKQMINLLAPPAIACGLMVPLFRLHPRDAALATGCALLGMVLLVLSAWVVVWASGQA